MMQKIDIPAGPEPMASTLIHTVEDLLNREQSMSEREFKLHFK